MMPAISLFKRMSVRQKILVIFLSLSLISLLITGIVAFTTINGIGDFAKNSSRELGETATKGSMNNLEIQAMLHMLQIAMDQAEITNVIFEDVNSEMEILAAQAVSLQDNPPLTPNISSFSRSAPPPDARDGTFAFLAPNTTTTQESEEFRTLAGMDDLLKAVLIADTDMVSIYIATDSGIMRRYPYENGTLPDYDPRKRPWFNDAKKTSKVVWGDPYDDKIPNRKVVTSSRAVQTKFGTWVIASDITTQQINENIIHLSPYVPNSAFLITSTGLVISGDGPCLSGTNRTCNEVIGSIINWSDPYLNQEKIGNYMVADKGGAVRSMEVDNQVIYISYAPVRSMNWGFALFRPASEIMAPAEKTGDAIKTATIVAGKEIDTRTAWILHVFAVLFCILLFIVILLSFLHARIITRPVEALRQGTVAIGKGDLDYRLTIDTGDEFEVLAHSFNTMASDLKQNIEDLRRTTADKERYIKEMEVAKEIQDNFLPEFTPKIPGIDLAATSIPAMEIGGDLYDFIPVAGDRWGLAIADVSGKGVSAALFMALCSTLIRVSGGTEADPSVVLEHANQLIYADGRSSMFITLFYGVLDPAKRTFTYVNAGHNSPLLVRGDLPAVRTLDESRCIALGVVPEVNIACAELELEPGDLIVMYTDGVTEAFNPQDEEFGEERLMDYLKEHRKYPVQEIMDGLIEEVRRFCGSRPQSDDITLLIVRVK
jgi:phosphoserine phosphatase RsbU/P